MPRAFLFVSELNTLFDMSLIAPFYIQLRNCQRKRTHYWLLKAIRMHKKTNIVYALHACRTPFDKNGFSNGVNILFTIGIGMFKRDYNDIMYYVVVIFIIFIYS